MSWIDTAALEEFGRLARLFERSRQALDEVLRRGDTSAGSSAILADETLPHIEGVEAGFKVRLRASDGSLEEMRGLVLEGGLGLSPPRDAAEGRAALIEAMRALSGAGGPRTLVPAAARHLAALEHARIAMAVVPLTLAQDVHFPGWPSYADIPVPRGPGEFAARIEEVERVVWRVATGRARRPFDAALRRAYAFFDVGGRLPGAGLAPA